MATYTIVSILCLAWVFCQSEHYQRQKISFPTYPILITGYVKYLLKNDPSHKQFLFQVISKPDGIPAKRLKLSSFGSHENFQVGDVWQLKVKLRPLHPLKNPGHFDEALGFYLKGIHGIGYVKDSLYNRRLEKNTHQSVLSKFRQKINNVIESISLSAKDNDEIAILKALSIGDRHLSKQAWKVFQSTGTSHLMAISGLHISLIAGIIYYSVRRLWSLSRYLIMYLPAFKAAAICSVVVTLLYGVISGFSLPTQRAIIMMLVVMLEKLINRYSPIYWRLLLALMVILLLQPLSVMTHSFWLSFIAVFCIIYHCNQWKYQQLSSTFLKRLMRWAQLQGIIFLSLLPSTLLFFGQVSLWCFIANGLAIPWICFGVLPVILSALLALSVSVTLSVYLFKIALILLTPLWLFLKWLANFDWGVWHHAVTRYWVIGVAYVGVLCVLTKKLLRFRFLGFFAFIPLIFFASPSLKSHAFRLIVFDVGQGLASLIQTKHHLLIYDAGPKYVTGFNAATHIILPYLSYMHLNTVDKLIISHDDVDHSGGAKRLLHHLNVKDFLTSNINGFGLRGLRKCYAGQHWQWDGVEFEILWPPLTLNYLGNNSSCVLKVHNKKISVLLTGDIESSTEQALVKRMGARLKSSILIVPHHGSNTSSTTDFLKKISPEYALFSSGYLNRFHFPAKKIWQRYDRLQIHRINTAFDGAIEINAKSDGHINIHTEKGKVVF